jgi:hypothetical protein
MKTNIFWLGGVFLIVFIVYILCPVTTSTDSRWTIYFSMSMIHEHDADLDEYAHLMEGDGDFRVVHRNGHIYSYFPLGVSIVSVPYVWAVEKVFDLRNSTDLETYLMNDFPAEWIGRTEMIGASLISALAAVFLYMLVSLQLGRFPALLLTFIFAFATPMLSTASRALWQHGLSVLCLTVVLWLLLRPSRNRWDFLMAGTLLGFSYVTRPTNSLSVLFLTLYILINHRKDLFFYFAGLFLPLGGLVYGSWQLYGTTLPPYYMPQRLEIGPQFFEALAGHLISPNRGIFISTPIFLLSLLGIYLSLKNRGMKLTAIDPYLVAILAAHWVVISSFKYWYGGWTLGPRFFADVAPYFVYFLILVFKESQPWSLKLWKPVFAMLLLTSTLVHFRYVTSSYPFLWNGKPVDLIDAPERIWDTYDLQVLRGTCEDRLEGRAPACWLEPVETK